MSGTPLRGAGLRDTDAPPARIFIVEDEALIAMELADRLAAIGYEICGQAARGEEAVARILQLRPDLVLMDIYLTGTMNGIEIARRLRESIDLPVIYLTANSDDELVREAMRTAPHGYLLKPFEPRALQIAIEVALSKHELEQRLRHANGELERRSRELVASERFNRATLDALPARVAVLAADGTVLATNELWRQHAAASEIDWHQAGEGQNYLAGCRAAASPGAAQARQVAQGVDAVAAGRQAEFLLEYPCPIHQEVRRFQCQARRFYDNGMLRVVVTHQDVTEIRRARRRLAASEQAETLIGEEFPIGIVHLDAKWRYQRGNRRWAEITGLPAARSTGTDWLGRIHPDDRAPVIKAWRRTAEEGTPTRLEHRYLRNDGTILWAMGHAARLDDEDGEVAGFVITLTDISEEKRIEIALRALSGDLAALGEDEYFDALARKLCESLGTEAAFVSEWRRGDPVHLTSRSLILDGAATEAPYIDVGGSPVVDILALSSVYIERGTAARYPTDALLVRHGIEGFAGVMMSDTDGRPLGIVGVMSRKPLVNLPLVTRVLDLYAASAAATLLRQRADRRFSELFELAPDAILMTDELGDIRLANRQAEVTFGWSRAELVGRSVEMLVPAPSRARHPRLRESYMEQRAKRSMGAGRPDLRALRKDGSEFPAEISLAPADLSDGRAVVVVVRDISDRVSLQAQLAQSQKMEAIGKLTGGLAHDFNNYLAVIVGNLDILLHHEGEDTPQRRLLDAALRGALQAKELTRSLLAFARRQPLAPRQIDIGALVGETGRLLERTLGEDITVKVAAEPGLWPVLVDEAQLAAAIVNLANNARDAMPGGGRFTIRITNIRVDGLHEKLSPEVSPGDYVMIEASDTGCGMAPDVLANVFEPFFTTKAPGSGTGLGLSMVYGFVNQSGGGVRIYSEPGHGTTVRLYLPRPQDGIATNGKSASPGKAMPRGDERILLVEDNEALRQTAAQQLAMLGYQVAEAESAAAALAILERPDHRFDLMLTDIVMPGGMDGHELSQRVRQRHPDMKVLLTSGFPGSTLEALGKDAEVRDLLLVKPYRTTDLAHAVRAALDGDGSSRQGGH